MKVLLALFLLLSPLLVFGQKFNTVPNTDGYQKVVETFYYNGKLNNNNNQIWFVESNNLPIYECLLDEDGKPRSWTFNTYSPDGVRIESQTYDIVNGKLKRWVHVRTEISTVAEGILSKTFTSYYEKTETLTETILKSADGRMLFSESNGTDASYNLSKYDSRGNKIQETIENEKSDGRHTFAYENTYDGDQLSNVKTSKDGALQEYEDYRYDGNFLKVVSSYDAMHALKATTEYQYNVDGKLVWTSYKNKAGKITFQTYSVYDGDFLKETGEKATDYERYWVYKRN